MLQFSMIYILTCINKNITDIKFAMSNTIIIFFKISSYGKMLYLPNILLYKHKIERLLFVLFYKITQEEPKQKEDVFRLLDLVCLDATIKFIDRIYVLAYYHKIWVEMSFHTNVFKQIYACCNNFEQLCENIYYNYFKGS